MSTRVFLTGITGYLGGVLAEHLSRLPEVTTITGIGPRPPRRPLPPKARFVPMDIRSPGVTGAMIGHDVVIHTAAVVLWRADMTAAERDDINLNGTRNVAQAALANRVPRFLHASSMAVYDLHRVRGQSGVTEDFPTGTNDPFFYYWTTKAATERLLASLASNSATQFTFLRPIYIIGPSNRETVRGLRANAVNFPGCNPRRQFIHEDDVAAAFIQAMRTEMPGAFNVVPDDFLRMRDVWRIVGVRFVPTLPRWLAVGITTARWRFLGSAIHPSWVEDLLVDFTGSNAKLRAAGWQPRYTSEAALRSAFVTPAAAV
jgi:nucleoside-diphosphate-sugar epimerase